MSDLISSYIEELDDSTLSSLDILVTAVSTNAFTPTLNSIVENAAQAASAQPGGSTSNEIGLALATMNSIFDVSTSMRTLVTACALGVALRLAQHVWTVLWPAANNGAERIQSARNGGAALAGRERAVADYFYGAEQAASFQSDKEGSSKQWRVQKPGRPAVRPQRGGTRNTTEARAGARTAKEQFALAHLILDLSILDMLDRSELDAPDSQPDESPRSIKIPALLQVKGSSVLETTTRFLQQLHYRLGLATMFGCAAGSMSVFLLDPVQQALRHPNGFERASRRDDTPACDTKRLSHWAGPIAAYLNSDTVKAANSRLQAICSSDPRLALACAAICATNAAQIEYPLEADLDSRHVGTSGSDQSRDVVGGGERADESDGGGAEDESDEDNDDPEADPTFVPDEEMQRLVSEALAEGRKMRIEAKGAKGAVAEADKVLRQAVKELRKLLSERKSTEAKLDLLDHCAESLDWVSDGAS
jgi:hypothetical protein